MDRSIMTDWELGVWGNGETCLYYEDVLHGQDVVISMNADGTATIRENPGRVRYNVSAIEILQFLRDFAQRAYNTALEV